MIPSFTMRAARSSATCGRRRLRSSSASMACHQNAGAKNINCRVQQRSIYADNNSCRRISSVRRRIPYNYDNKRNEFSTAAATTSDQHDEPMDEQINTMNDGLESLVDLSPGMQNRVRAMKSRHDEVLELLRDGGDQTALGKELSSLSQIASLCDRVYEIHAERESLVELINETQSAKEEDNDYSKELMEEINEELSQLEMKLHPLSRKMLHSLVPLLNPDDIDDLTSADAVIDIRAGTGGDEACLFAGEIMSGYESAAKAGGGDESGSGGKSWNVEVLSVSRTDLGGVKEASLVVSYRGGGGSSSGSGYSGGYGNTDSNDTDSSELDTTERLLQQLGPYGFFQYESGVHRVQRVPINDAKMQTSAVAVAVLPSLPDNKIASALPPSELKIDTMRASGAGGQHVNTTESAVRVTHVPTGCMAYMQEERSQHKNKAKALKLVAARVHQLRKEQALKDRSATRSSLMGGGDRSERIRTYNFQQDRITDHRCKVSVQGVSSWLGGGAMVRKFGPHLYEMEREERFAAFEEEDEEERKRGNASSRGKGKSGKKKR